MTAEPFAEMLSGGHPNSLGRTLEVVEIVLADRARLAELYSCYFSLDEVVRLRTSSALKRVCREHPEWLEPYIDPLLEEIAQIEQASAQWTLAQLLGVLTSRMSAEQVIKAKVILRRNLSLQTDWIVLNATMQTLAEWAGSDEELKTWLKPQLERLSTDTRKSVAGRATKLRSQLYRNNL